MSSAAVGLILTPHINKAVVTDSCPGSLTGSLLIGASAKSGHVSGRQTTTRVSECKNIHVRVKNSSNNNRQGFK